MMLTDREEVRQRLERWLGVQLPAASAMQVAPLRIPLGTGNSAETAFIDVRFVRDGVPCERKLVLRRQYEGSDLFLDANLELPFRMMEALSKHSRIRSPRVLGVEFDRSILGSPFLVMDAIDGRVVPQTPNYNLGGWLAELAPAQRHEVWCNALEAIAELHRLSWRKGFEFLHDPARGAPGLDSYLHWVRDWYRWARGDRPQPVADVALEFLFANQPANPEICVLWGDATPGNTLFAMDLSVAGLIDFEMATLGPREVDLAWWIFFDDFYGPAFGLERLAGLPNRAETVAIYEQASGHTIENLDYYLLLARFRMNIVGIRWVDRLVASGRLAPGTDAMTHNVITKMMAQQLGLPVPEPGAGFAAMVAASVKKE
jgi:aminoglycoside phosphotransferase (APT) family kinase protein